MPNEEQNRRLAGTLVIKQRQLCQPTIFKFAGVAAQGSLRGTNKQAQHRFAALLPTHKVHVGCTARCSVSVCALTIHFETHFGERFSRPLPTPVCLMSFDPELAPVRCSSSLAPRAYAVRLRNEEASIQGVVERVQERTGGSCTVIRSPIAGAAARTAQHAGLHRSAVPGTYRMHRTATACACM